MEFGNILLVLDKTLRKTFGIEETNKFLVEFMKQCVDAGFFTKVEANKYLYIYGCKLF
uniref:Uncharacterized protein n=1 Tax=viral metagenome TaxID=1070528 RepID=A0A6C0EQW0_9ZZZZ